MSCSTCARIRRRIAEEAAKLKAAIARRKRRPTTTTHYDAYGQRWEFDELGRPLATYPAEETHSRRDVLRSLLIGAVAATGLARVQLELVDEVVHDFENDVLRYKGQVIEMQQLMDVAWREGGKPDLIIVNPEIFKAFQEAIR